MRLAKRRNWYSMRIYEHLKRRGLDGQRVAEQLSVSGAAVSRTITGKSHSPRILEKLRSVGVPEELLFDPRRMKVARKEAA